MFFRATTTLGIGPHSSYGLIAPRWLLEVVDCGMQIECGGESLLAWSDCQ